jgi:hypothetical protein
MEIKRRASEKARAVLPEQEPREGQPQMEATPLSLSRQGGAPCCREGTGKLPALPRVEKAPPYRTCTIVLTVPPFTDE